MTVRRLLATFFVFALLVSACGTGAPEGSNGNGSAYPYPGGTEDMGNLNGNSNGFDATTSPAATVSPAGTQTGGMGTTTAPSVTSGAATTSPMASPSAMTTGTPASLPGTGATSSPTQATSSPAGATATATRAITAAATTATTGGYDQGTTTAPGATAVPTQQGGVQSTPITGAQVTVQPGQGTALPLPNTGGSPDFRAVILQPEMRESLMRVSNLLTGFTVRDASGQTIGTISDFIVNTCETFIIYVVVDGSGAAGVQATPAAGAQTTPTQAQGGAQASAGGRFLIPFEAFTVNGGAWDARAKALIINIPADQVRQAPAFTATRLLPLDWEGQARSFWDTKIRMSNLGTNCSTPSGNVQKVAFASQLTRAQLRDANGTVLGQLVDAVLEPESGSIDFFVVQTANSSDYVLVPLGAVNIPEEALQGGGANQGGAQPTNTTGVQPTTTGNAQPTSSAGGQGSAGQGVWLVLLTDAGLLQNAPTVTSIEAGLKMDAANQARQYWNR